MFNGFSIFRNYTLFSLPELVESFSAFAIFSADLGSSFAAPRLRRYSISLQCYSSRNGSYLFVRCYRSWISFFLFFSGLFDFFEMLEHFSCVLFAVAGRSIFSCSPAIPSTSPKGTIFACLLLVIFYFRILPCGPRLPKVEHAG